MRREHSFSPPHRPAPPGSTHAWFSVILGDSPGKIRYNYWSSIILSAVLISFRSSNLNRDSFLNSPKQTYEVLWCSMNFPEFRKLKIRYQDGILIKNYYKDLQLSEDIPVKSPGNFFKTSGWTTVSNCPKINMSSLRYSPKMVDQELFWKSSADKKFKWNP